MMKRRTRVQAALAAALLTSISFMFAFLHSEKSSGTGGVPIDGTEPGNFSVGFDLTHSYGVAAVDYHNGTVSTLGPIDGSEAFQEVMQRLSLYSSCHLAPPYNNVGESFQDYPRQMKRAVRKKIGLPASADVGVLAKMLQALREAAEREVAPGKVTAALVAAPHLPALYQEDLVDAFEYLGLGYINHRNWYRPLFYETAVAYAGYGLGLCANYTDPDACGEEQGNMTSKPVLAVTYTKYALTTTFATMGSAFGMWTPPYRVRINTKLGSAAADTCPAYWDDVRLELQNLTDTFPGFPKPKEVLILGDGTQSDDFGRLTRKLFDSYGTDPKVYDASPVVAAAVGAAEFAKRSQYPYTPPPVPPPNSTLTIDGVEVEPGMHMEF